MLLCNWLRCCAHRHNALLARLLQSDPSGNYSGWRAAAIGANSQSAQATLKADYS